MRTVARQELDTVFAAQQVEDLEHEIGRTLPRLERVPRALSGFLTETLMVSRYRCALDPTASQAPTRDSVTLAMQAGSAIFAAAAITEGTVRCRIHTGSYDLPATGCQYWTGPGNWLTAFWLAVVCRDKERTTMLCDIPLTLLRAADNTYEPYFYAWIEALQMFWRREPGHYDKLIEAVRGTDPGGLPADTHEFVLLQLYPPMKMVAHLLAGEHELFNDALYEALDLHRSFWTRTADRAKDPDGYYALGVLAVTCLAHEMGVTIDVESPYIPTELVSTYG
jgi:hypothetical protein